MSYKQALSIDDVAQVVGGALTINGTELDMNKTPADYVETYPFVQSAMGVFYNAYKNTTLNDICSQMAGFGGEAYLQNLIDNYISEHNITF